MNKITFTKQEIVNDDIFLDFDKEENIVSIEIWPCQNYYRISSAQLIEKIKNR